MKFTPITAENFACLSRDAVGTHRPPGKSPRDRHLNYPPSPIKRTLQLRDGTLVSEFDYDACRRHPSARCYIDAGITREYPFGMFTETK